MKKKSIAIFESFAIYYIDNLETIIIMPLKVSDLSSKERRKYAHSSERCYNFNVNKKTAKSIKRALSWIDIEWFEKFSLIRDAEANYFEHRWFTVLINDIHVWTFLLRESDEYFSVYNARVAEQLHGNSIGQRSHILINQFIQQEYGKKLRSCTRQLSQQSIYMRESLVKKWYAKQSGTFYNQMLGNKEMDSYCFR